ncbi:hypothetical protein [Bartonella heixiaziensis]
MRREVGLKGEVKNRRREEKEDFLWGVETFVRVLVEGVAGVWGG